MMNSAIKKKKVSFHSGKIKCIGYLFLPTDFDINEKKFPCIILGPGFGGTQDTPSIIYNKVKDEKNKP